MQSKIKAIALGLGLAFGVAGGAQAATVLSMTIEEIGAASGGLGTSAAGATDAGVFYFGAEKGDGVTTGSGIKLFHSAGSTDGKIIMGTAQGNGAFTTGFIYGGAQFSPNTLNGAPSGTATALGTMTLDLSGWGGTWAATGKNYSLFPDAGTLVTSAKVIDATHFYYTADWSHVITAAEDPDFADQRADWHIEGIATTTPVPVPAAAWLLGSGLLGLVGVARRRKVAA